MKTKVFIIDFSHKPIQFSLLSFLRRSRGFNPSALPVYLYAYIAVTDVYSNVYVYVYIHSASNCVHATYVSPDTSWCTYVTNEEQQN